MLTRRDLIIKWSVYGAASLLLTLLFSLTLRNVEIFGVRLFLTPLLVAVVASLYRIVGRHVAEDPELIVVERVVYRIHGHLCLAGGGVVILGGVAPLEFLVQERFAGYCREGSGCNEYYLNGLHCLRM